ncbi:MULTISPECIES: helix-turn-helix domain-containing protein [unclassified Flavobacterium]|uniref:XRE family transcriptional regulator n=1 Tax=unclassified Flavobacterium TaxID=196869 RepID=UPI001F1408AF|nr:MULTISPECIES: helix-turn-helix domain-containing protein [unclassified Flavobacterium]UMY65882.1 helix-turn-helix domain-containing protein [Flavobacterium sp. HJ-32-4]
MSIFSDNLRHLRLGRSFSQQKLANDLIITRERLAKYEEGRSEPPFEILRRIALFFNVSIDLLLSVDIRKVEIDRLLKTADNRILLPITVDASGNDTIEIIPYKARAGYTTGYADPEFIENLQRISLPFLTNGKFRAFPVEGDSMPPHREGSFIIGKYVENLGDVRDGKTYIVLTRNDGIVYKRLNRNGKNSLMLHSDNAVYRPYEIKASEILEIWEFACSLSTKEAEPEDLSNENIRDILQELRKDIRRLKEN